MDFDNVAKEGAWNWTEDYPHENGRYQNKCGICGQLFMGHKRRAVCKVCAEPDWESLAKKQAPEDNKCAHAGCWADGEMTGFARCMVKNVFPLRSQLQAKEEEIKALESKLSKFDYAKQKAMELVSETERMANSFEGEMAEKDNRIKLLEEEIKRLRESIRAGERMRMEDAHGAINEANALREERDALHRMVLELTGEVDEEHMKDFLKFKLSRKV
jgi:DNA repair exonuclease SbcCD ATPase subunit